MPYVVNAIYWAHLLLQVHCVHIFWGSLAFYTVHMHSRVMRLVVLVCVWVCDQKIDLFTFEKILLSVLYYLLMKFKHLRSGFLHPASCTYGAIHACSIIVGSGILYYGMPHLKALSH